MLRVELHCHTIYSKDSLTTPRKLVETCERRGIDRVVVTDHNTIAGALLAKQIDPGRVIIGEEIMTTRGELLAFFVQEEIPPGLEPAQVLDRLKEQSAFISVSHPFDRWRKGHWQEQDLIAILPYLDAIETFNARCWLPSFNKEAANFAQTHNIPGTAGSDAHAAFELGKASMLLPEFETTNELRQSLQNGQFHVSLSYPWVHFTSRYAVWYKRIASRVGRKLTQ